MLTLQEILINSLCFSYGIWKDLFYIFVQVRFQYTFETVSGFIIPYAVIIMCYVLILRRLRQTKFQRKVHSEKLILAIVVTFGIFWLPYHVINMLQVCRGLFWACFSEISNAAFTQKRNFERCLLVAFSFFILWGGGGSWVVPRGFTHKRNVRNKGLNTFSFKNHKTMFNTEDFTMFTFSDGEISYVLITSYQT